MYLVARDQLGGNGQEIESSGTLPVCQPSRLVAQKPRSRGADIRREGPIEQFPRLGALAKGGLPTDRQRMSGFDGVKTTAAVKYRQFEPSWAHYPRHPNTKRGEEGAESGIFPRLSPILDGSCSPHPELTWGTISSREALAGTRLAQCGRHVPVKSRLCHRHHAVAHQHQHQQPL